jgi:hypothetical protein
MVNIASFIIAGKVRIQEANFSMAEKGCGQKRQIQHVLKRVWSKSLKLVFLVFHIFPVLPVHFLHPLLVRDNLVKLHNQLYPQVAVFRQIEEDPGGECKESGVLVRRRGVAHEELVLAQDGTDGFKAFEAQCSYL